MELSDTSQNLRNDPTMVPSDRYFSCNALESNNIVFFNNGTVRPCCRLVKPVTYNRDLRCIEPELGGAFFIDFDEFSFEEYQNRKEQCILHFQKGNFKGCKGCTNIRECQEKKSSDIIKNIDFAFYSTCNLQCIYCPLKTWYHHSINDYYDQVLKCVDDLLKGKKIRLDANISFSGGEPALLPGLKDLCRRFRGYSDSISFRFLTNAVIFSDAISEMIQSGSDITLLISIDSGTRAGYFRIKGRDHFTEVIQNIKKYKDLAVNQNLNIILKFIIINENIDEIPHFFNLCNILDLKDVTYDVDFLTMRDPVITEAIQQFCELAEKNHLHWQDCGVGSQ